MVTASPEISDRSLDGFDSTHWSLITAAAQDPDPRGALDRLCRTYWPCIYVFVRRSGLSPEDAQDATQDFVLYFLERSWVREASPAKGSFRALLLTLLRNFLSNRRRSRSRLKRGAGVWFESLETSVWERELASLEARALTPAAAYDRSWAQSVLSAAMDQLAAENAAGAGRFALLRPFVAESPGPGDYERIGQALGLSRAQVAKAIHRLTRRFAQLVRAEIAGTLVGSSEIDAEMQELLRSLS